MANYGAGTQMRQEGEIIGDGSPSLNPHSLEDPSNKSHQLGVVDS